ncbi:MAG: hypothetical protein JST26_08565 [Bacteroidetes bacterium]|nr:hypothetical protein [Bacteroidota bacterium]
MMKLTSFLSCALLATSIASAQVQYTAGPELDNDRDNKMNRMLGGDDNSFYAYRIRSKGKGTSFFIEKYDKKTLKPVFSKEVNLDEEGQTKIEDVEYAQGNVFIFRRQYDKKADKMTLFFQTVSSAGVVSPQLKEIVTINSDHYEFVDFDIFPNPSQTKFVIKASHKANKTDEYKTDFILMDAAGMKKVWTKTVNQKLHSGGYNFSFFGGLSEVEGVGFIGLYVDDKDNIYWGYNGLAKTSTDKERRYRLNLYTMNAADNTPKQLELLFDDDYLVSDIEFSKSNDNEIVVGGFMKDVIERKGRDLVKCGIFSFKVNLTNNTVAAKTFQFFDDKMLAALESNARRSRYFKYKLDYIIPVGDAVYYVGEQYNEQYVSNNSSYGMGSMGGMNTGSNSYWQYEYMDVIVAKLTPNGKFEWIKNVPLRNEMRMNFAHVFKQYIAVATSKNLYILCDDHPKNMERYEKADFEPKDLKSVQGIHGSNFVCNTVALTNGNITRKVVFENEKYCFAPIQERNPQFIPPSDCEIFVPSKNNEIFIYTEDRGADQFGKLKFD